MDVNTAIDVLAKAATDAESRKALRVVENELERLRAELRRRQEVDDDRSGRYY